MCVELCPFTELSDQKHIPEGFVESVLSPLVQHFSYTLIRVQCVKFRAYCLTDLQTVVIHFTVPVLSSKGIKERSSRFPEDRNRHGGWSPKVGAILSFWLTRNPELLPSR